VKKVFAFILAGILGTTLISAPIGCNKTDEKDKTKDAAKDKDKAAPAKDTPPAKDK